MEVKKEYDFFDFEGFHIEYCSLLKMLNDKKIPYNYSALSFQCYNNTYIIMYNQKKAFVYKKTIEVIIQDDNNQTILLMHSDLDMKKTSLLIIYIWKMEIYLLMNQKLYLLIKKK